MSARFALAAVAAQSSLIGVRRADSIEQDA